MSSPTVPEQHTIARPVETAPSQTAADEPSWARTIGLMGIMLSVLGLTVVIFNEIYGPRIITKGWGFVFVAIGIASMLFHAVRDNDIQIRRAYGFIGYALLGLIALLTIINTTNFLAYGWACALASLCFLLTFSRHETDPVWRNRILWTLCGVGTVLAAVGFGGGLMKEGFILTYGLVCAVVGLAWLCAFVSQSDPTTEAGYRTGVGLGGAAVFLFLYAVLRSAVPPLLKMNVSTFFVPTGLLIMFLAGLYGSVAIGIISDNKLVVLTRRELTSYFYSPIAYVVMVAMALLGGLAYWAFVASIVLGGVMFEPIVAQFYQMFPPIVVLFLVPAITMRLLSEEKRTGTYEVLMCAPVKESTVVLSKFLASLAFFMLLWGIWALYLIALRVEGGKEFDYRPLLGFYLALTISGAGFISMGLFFSSLSRNQVIASVLTFIGMLVIFFIGMLGRQDRFTEIAPQWRAVYLHLSYTNLWEASLVGQIHLREIMLQGSFAFFWLFLTVKVLEARRWS